MSKVEILRDLEYEMIKVTVDGELVTECNFWDMDIDTWVNILRKAGVSVSQGRYSYE